jgi:hypothetical protein
MIGAPFLLLVAMGAGAAAPPHIATHRWADGLTLVVQPVAGARTSSLRLVVRAGAFVDPVGKAGLAHMLEHVLLRGPSGRELLRDARAARGSMNAFTTGAWTMFVLDAPSDRFSTLAERALKLVTSPDFLFSGLAGERALVDQEASFRGASAEVSLLDAALFPSPEQTGPLIGTAESRGDFRTDDVRRYFQEHYVPPLTTIVLTGAVTLEDGVALVERGYLVPPVAAPAARPPDSLNLPVEQHVPSWATLVAQGYVIDPRDREVCESLAALLEFRLTLAVREAGPRVPQVGASCHRLRGRDLLVALAYTSTFDVPDLPDRVSDVFQSLARSLPGAAERALVDRRLSRRKERVSADPAALADVIALHAGAFGEEGLASLHPAGLPGAQRLQEVVSRSLVAERRFQLDFSPRE